MTENGHWGFDGTNWTAAGFSIVPGLDAGVSEAGQLSVQFIIDQISLCAERMDRFEKLRTSI